MSAPASTDTVASPCVSVCVMLPAAGVCAGCFRTLDEIAGWGGLDADARRDVLAALPARRARWGEIARAVAAGVRPLEERSR